MAGVTGERQRALLEGRSQYYTGKQCKHGHKAPRLTASGACLVCARFYRTRAARKNPVKAKARDLKKYGLSLEQYEAMLLKQFGRCRICKRSPEEFGGRLHIDHCHTTGKVRALLCPRCNGALGHIESQMFDLYRDYLVEYGTTFKF